MNKQNRNRLIDNREHFGNCQIGGGLEGWVKNGEGIKKYKLAGTE